MAEYLSKDACVGLGYLTDWYITSVSENDKPVWTDEHIEELYNDFYVIPKDTATVDALTVKQAKWEICSDGYYPYCSNCKSEPPGLKMTHFCPNCGAYMHENKVKEDKNK